MDVKKVDAIIDSYKSDPSSILAMMQDIQDAERYVPKQAMERIAERLNIPMTRVYRVATFYDSIHLEPRGKHVCKVCTGTSCHVRGADKVMKQLENDLQVKAGGTTRDKAITIEEVSCFGACASGPLTMIDDEYHENMTPDKMKKAVDQLRQK